MASVKRTRAGIESATPSESRELIATRPPLHLSNRGPHRAVYLTPELVRILWPRIVQRCPGKSIRGAHHNRRCAVQRSLVPPVLASVSISHLPPKRVPRVLAGPQRSGRP